MRSFYIFFIFLLAPYIGCFKNASAQEFSYGYFRSPIDEPILLAGNFGELRANHFHTGIDIKICGTEGLPIYAAADGYVSRIGISGAGYGNALYIDHPNGYTTVYAHLFRYNNSISEYIRQTQYFTQSFEQNIFPEPTKFQVKKGDLIGFGGNSGSSRGAHLHFEIRETKSEKPVNPMLFGFEIADTIKPVIRSVKIYTLEPGSAVKIVYTSGKSITAKHGQNIKVDVFKTKGSFRLKNISRIYATGTLGFAIQSVDYHEGSFSSLGPYSVELCLNQKRQYYHRMHRLDFDLKRYINAHADFPELQSSGRWYERSFLLPNNKLPIYEGLINGGKINITGAEPLIMTYYVKDVYENTSVLSFNINPDISLKPSPDTSSVPANIIEVKYNQPFILNQNGFICKIPAGHFYDDFKIPFNILPVRPKTFSAVYELGSKKIPVNDTFTVAIAPEDLPERLREKACLASVESGYLGGIFSNGYIWSQTRILGKYYVTTDTIAPVITPVNIKPGTNMWNKVSVKFLIRDNFSGIKSYRGIIDGKWVLFQYDAKKALLWYQFDENCPPGKHELILEVTDNRNNVRRYKTNFSR